jgi:hypothetical protein
MESEIEANKDNHYLVVAPHPTDYPQREAELGVLVFFLKTMVKQKHNLAATVKEEQALRSSLSAFSRQILDLARTVVKSRFKGIEESTGANRNMIKVQDVKKLRRIATRRKLGKAVRTLHPEANSRLRFALYEFR